MLSTADLGSDWESQAIPSGFSKMSGSPTKSCDGSLVPGPWHARAGATFYQSASGELSTATEQLQSSTSAVAEYESAVGLLTRCGSRNPSAGELRRMALPRVGARSAAFQVIATSKSAEDNPMPFRGALVVAVKGDVLLFLASGTSGPFDLDQFHQLVEQAVARIP